MVHNFLAGGEGDSLSGASGSAFASGSSLGRPEFAGLRLWGGLPDMMPSWLRMLAAAALPSGGTMEQLLLHLQQLPATAAAAAPSGSADCGPLSAAQQAVLALMTPAQALQLCSALEVTDAGIAALVLVEFTAAVLREAHAPVSRGARNVQHAWPSEAPGVAMRAQHAAQVRAPLPPCHASSRCCRSHPRAC